MSIGVISTDPYHGYAVVFSPFISGKLAIVGGLNFGIAGPGALVIFESSLATGFRESRRYIYSLYTAHEMCEHTYIHKDLCMYVRMYMHVCTHVYMYMYICM